MQKSFLNAFIFFTLLFRTVLLASLFSLLPTIASASTVLSAPPENVPWAYHPPFVQPFFSGGITGFTITFPATTTFDTLELPACAFAYEPTTLTLSVGIGLNPIDTLPLTPALCPADIFTNHDAPLVSVGYALSRSLTFSPGEVLTLIIETHISNNLFLGIRNTADVANFITFFPPVYTYPTSFFPDQPYYPAFTLANNAPIIPPTLTTLGQFKSDGSTPLSSLEVTTEDTVTLKGTPESEAGKQVQLEAEVRPTDIPFTEANATSMFVTSGTETAITFSGLTNGSYHWRMRAVDEEGSASDWQEFPGVFEVKVVPLYTQVRSVYPSVEETDLWSKVDYADGRGNLPEDPNKCGQFIRNCGCAISSLTMLARYYGIDTLENGASIDPLAFNQWLLDHNAYTKYGNVLWSKIATSTKGKLAFRGFATTQATLNAELAVNRPAIAFHSGHFNIIDGKLASTYTIRDPFWYNTHYLNQIVTDKNTERNYHNTFDSLRLFSYHPLGDGHATGFSAYLASPAELLLTDNLGHRFGKDPRTGEVFNEITGGVYYEEGIGNPETATDTDPTLNYHHTKNLDLPELPEGTYRLDVIGTGAGAYTLGTTLYDATGTPHTDTITASTTLGGVTTYTVNYTPNTPDTLTITPLDTTPPEALITFSTSTNAISIQGIDDSSTTTLSSTTTYPTLKKNQKQYNGIATTTVTINDLAGNTTLLTYTEKLPSPERRDIINLISIAYNGATSSIPATLKYKWNTKQDGTYTMFASTFSTSTMVIESHYRPKKNITVIMQKPIDLDDRDDDDDVDTRPIKTKLSGLVIPILQTRQGNIDVTY